MASLPSSVTTPIAKELQLFAKRFGEAMKSNVALLDAVTRYIVKRKGKQVRPMFVFLSSLLHGGITEATYTAASLIELLHTATLVHDDVVDDSYERRGFFSVNALWKNKIAVLVGDYLLARGLLLSIERDEFRLLKLVANSVREMSEGELLQIEKTRRLDIKEEVYFEIIRQKTATLIASACATGAAASGASDEEVENMRRLGETIGIAFQIKDDLLDFGSDDIGKPKGIDIQEKKLTLPLIYSLRKTNPTTRKHIIYIVKNNNTDRGKVQEVVAFVHKEGGIAYANEQMINYRDEALQMLANHHQSPARTALEDLVRFTVDRRK
jgi:octaprenyl-diphosphate synthase